MKKIFLITTAVLLSIIVITTTTQAMPSITATKSATGSVDNVIRQVTKPVKYK